MSVIYLEPSLSLGSPVAINNNYMVTVCSVKDSGAMLLGFTSQFCNSPSLQPWENGLISLCFSSSAKGMPMTTHFHLFTE